MSSIHWYARLYPHVCPHCELEDKDSIIRWGFTTCLILLNDISDYQTYLHLKKHRFFCQSCNRSFVAKTGLVEKHCSISTKVKLSIADQLRKVSSMIEKWLHLLSGLSLCHDFARFYALLDEYFSRLPPYYQTTIDTFKKYQSEIKSTLELPYSNGPLECLNNPIKVLKRNAYGFRNFYNFKLRISLCFGTILFQENKKPREKFL